MEKVEENAGEAVEPMEEESSEEEETQPSKDPLDAIEDEEARNEAKRLRAINARAKKKEVESEPESVPSNFATKDDLKVIATNDAKKLVAPEVRELWDELTKIPLGGYDAMDSDQIAANMNKRYALYQIENPASEDPVKDLTSSPVVPKASGAEKPKAKKETSLPGFKEPQQPTDWYPDPNA
jgi:vacuolar-type H+-ATPase subunit E/Vma4